MSGLPPDAAIYRVEGKTWTDIHELLATIAESVDHARLEVSRPNYEGALKDHEPLRIKRPGDPDPAAPDGEAENRIVTESADIARWFGANS